MSGSMRQQIVISGVGGQGILFVTRLLAEAAVMKGFSVFTSETHGMAQRGGTVLSHLKVGNFSSPLIRPANADGLLALTAGGLSQHGFYLKPDAWAAVNRREDVVQGAESPVFAVDANGLAQRIHQPKSVNLILLGFTIGVVSKTVENRLFCSLEDLKTVLEKSLAGKKKMLGDAVTALETGFNGLGTI
jgi:indolepyruvate ferredoxin oxidoreductase beta subunit